ncbi:hypothetical protein OAL14_05780 [Gammaproteobacteria bacterium]|nr:hypothetical protein [Gammaproteobacteria bacterium]
MDNKESVIVFTHRTIEFLTKLNASTSWFLNPRRAMNCEYLICTRNSKNPLAIDDFEHGTAFLIAKIINVTQSLNLPRDADRYMIEFEEYAEVTIPNVWKSWRSPVIYKNAEELKIDFDSLRWEPVPTRDENFIYDYFAKENKYYESQEAISDNFKRKKQRKNNNGLTIGEAKEQLSKFYDIPEENIDIILRG